MKNHSSALPKFKNKSSSSSLRLVLENRLVFDGAALATAVEVHQENAVDNHATANTPEAAPPPPGEPNVAFVPGVTSDAVAYQPNAVDASSQPAFAVDPVLPEASAPPGLNAGSVDKSLPSPAIAEPHSAAELSLPPNSPANTPSATLEPTPQDVQPLSATLGPERQAFHPLAAPRGEQHDAVDTAQDGILPDARAAETPHEIIFVDARVQDLNAFLAGRSTTEVIVLNPEHDGVEQMATALAGRTGIDAIHILSHGDAGQLYLGDSTLDAHSISGEHADELAAIKTALSSNADILIYGCDVAAGDQGQAFVTALATATGADVAASIDSTGSAGLGGDWQLESDTGNIESAALAFTQYQGLLAAPAITDSVISPRTTAEDVSLAMAGITIADTDGNNQTVTLTATNGILTLATTSGLTGLSGNGTGVVAFAGTLAQVNAAINGMTFGPAANYSGAATIAMSANDGSTTANLPVNITVNPVSDAPMLSVSPASGNEDTPIALTITAALTDPSETLAVTLSAIPAGSALTNTAGDTLTISAGSITLTSAQLAGLKILPPADYNGSMVLTVTAASIDGTASPAGVTDTLTVTVLPVNDAPVGNADAIAANEDGGPSSGNVLGNDVNADAANGEVLAVIGVRTGTVSGSGTAGNIGTALTGVYGNLTLNATGDYTYAVDNTLDEVQALAAGQTVSESFTYTVTDGITPVTAGITVTVTGVNDAPVLVSQPAITLTPIPEDTLDAANTGQLVSSLLVDTASGTTLVTDADAGTVPGIAITSALGGVNGMAGVWQYQLNGSGSWTGFGPVSTTNALLLPADAKVRFVVTENPADDTKEFGAARLSYLAWDGSAGSAGGLVDASVFSATAAFSSATLDATLNVTTVNDVPVLTQHSGSIDENTPLVFSAATLNVTDPDNSPVQIMYKLDVLPAHGDVIKNGLVLGLDSLFSQDDINNGLVSYRYTGVDLGPAGGADNFTVSVRDGAGGVLTDQVVTLTLTDDNALITATPTAFTVNERIGSEAADFGIINLNMSDADGDPALMTLTLNSLPNPQVGRLQYWNGSSYVDAALNQSFTQSELTAHPLRFISTGAEPVGALASTTFNVTANDTRGSTDTKTITVTIAPVNDIPDALVPAPIFSVNQGSPLNTITHSYLNLVDADSNTATKITYTLNTLPALGALYYVRGGQNLLLGAGTKFTQADIDAGFIRYTHFGATPADANFSTAEDHFGYTLADGDGGFKTGLIFDINVDPTNYPPVAHTETLVKQTVFTGNVAVTDFYLDATDPDNPPDSTLVFKLTDPAADLPPHTRLLINGVPAGAGSSFTQQDILDNNIIFQRTAGDIADVGAYSVRFTLTDGIAVTPMQTWRVILITPEQAGGPGGEGGAVAQFPEVDTNLPLSVAEGTTKIITSSQLHTSSLNPADVFTYTVKTAPDPAQGSIYVNGSLISAGGSFTQADIDAGNVAYVHTGAEVEALSNSAAPFTFDVSNGTYQARNQVFMLNLTPVNDAPAITQTQPTLPLSEGTTPVPLNAFDVSSYVNAIKLTTAQLQDSDAEVNAGAGSQSELIYVITAAPGGGNITLWNSTAWAPLKAGDRFSAADIAAGNVAYFHAPASEPNSATDRVTVYLTDGGSNPDGSAARSGEATVNFAVNNVNDAPVARDSAFTLSEGGTQLLNTSLLAVSDSDADDNTVAGLAARSYAIVSLPAHGTIEIDRGAGFVPLTSGETFTLADLNAGKLRYVHDSSENVTDGFTYQVTDSHSANSKIATVSISVRPVNDVPTAADGYGKVAEGNLLAIGVVNLAPPPSAGTLNPDGTGTGDFFNSHDPDNSIEQVQYRLTSSVVNGRLYLDNGGGSTVTLGAGSAWSFSLVDLVAGKVKYQHNGTETTSDSFNFTVSDGSGGIEPTGVFHIAITPVNDAPVLTGFGAIKNYIEDQAALVIAPGATLADIDLANGAGSFNNGTLTISGATASNDVLAVRNQGSGAGQIGLSGADVTYNGTVIGKVAGGSGGSPLVISFNSSSSAAAVQALMRNITFVNTDTANPPESSRSVLFTLKDGGGTDYNGHDTATATVTVTVARVNDAPILAAASPVLGTITEDDIATGLTTTVAALTGSTITDADNGAVQGIAITGLVSGNGFWQYNTGSGWNAIGTVADTGALLLRPADSIRFIPDGKNATTATVTYRAWDQATGSAGGKVNTTAGDGTRVAPTDTSAFSIAHDTATVNVTAVNDAPTGLGNLTLTSIGEDTVSPAGAAINALTGLDFQDVDTGATLAGVAIIGNAANPSTEGVWQYATDGNWKAIGTVADGATALALSAATQVRFVPVSNYNGTPPSLTVRALDNTYSGSFSSTTGGTETREHTDSTVNGGATAVSANTNTIVTTVTPVNDPPTITPDKTISSGVTEGSPIVISNSTVALVTVDDIEAARNEGAGANQGKVSVTISVPNGLSHGKVALGSTTGIAITAGANNSDTVTIKGSLTDVNTALNGLSFTPGVDTNTSETVTVIINDLGNNGAGTTTPLTTAQTITIDAIVPGNNTPVVTRPATVTATEDTPFSFTGANTISIADVDVRSSDIVELTLNLSSAGTFRFSQASGLFTDAAGTTPYTLSNETAGANVAVYGTLANLNAALNALVYTPASNLNSVNTGPDYIGGSFGGHVHLDVTVNDRGYGAGGVVSGTLLSDTKTIDITVNPVNDAPSMSGPAASSAYTEQAAPVSIGAGVLVADSIDDTQLSGATVTISANFRTGDLLAATTAGTGINAAYNAATHILTLSGVDSIANYNAVLQSMTFSNPSNDAPTSGGATTRTISWQATDNNADSAANGVQASNAVTSTINITAVSNAPAGTDKIVTTNEDQPYTFKVADFGFTDPLDNPADTLQSVLITTLPVNGTLKLNGVNVSAGDTILATDLTAGKLAYTPVTDANGSAYTSFTFQVEDTGSVGSGGVILDPSPNTMTINVTPINDAPVFTATAGNPSVTENGTTGGLISVDPVALLNAGSSAADIDLTTTAGLNSTVFGAGSISVSFTDAYVTGDVLFVNGVLPSGVTTTGGAASALTINLAATTTLAQVNSILDAIAYKSTSDNPTVNDTDSTRLYTIVISDGNNLQGAPTPNAGGPTALSSNIINGTLTLTRTNDAPVVDLNGAAAGTNNAVTWTEGANVAHTAIAIAPNAILTDVDNTNLTQIVMLIGGVSNGNNEVLTIGGVDFPLATVAANSAVGSFLVSYNGTNTFTIVPNGASFALAASFQTLIRGITYNNTTDNPAAGNRTVNFTVTDAGYDNGALIGGELDSNTPVATIAVIPVNDKPRITELTPVTYRENAINAAAALIDGNIALTDADSADYNGGTLTVSGLVAGQDTVSLPGAAAALPGNVQIIGGTVEYYTGSSWVGIGTASGGVGANFVVTFNANATTAIVERVIENLMIANSSDNPALTRTLKLTVDDGDTGGTLQTNEDLVVTIALDNDAPVMTATSLGGTYTEQNAAALQFVGGVINVSDPDSPANFFTGGIGSVTVALDTYLSGDTLSVLNQGNAAGQIGVAGATVNYGGLAFASTSGGNGAPLVITFTSGTATPAAVQALLSQLGYRNTANDDPTVNNTDPSRVFTVTLDDGGNIKNGGPTTALTTQLTGTINLAAVNDVPVITPAGQGSYIENAVATGVDNTVTVTDADDTHITGGTISITGNFLAGDTLAVSTMGNITAGYASSTGILSLSGTDTLANYQTVLRSLTYLNSTDDPTDNTTKATRTLTYSLTDANSDAAGAATGTATKIINVIPQTDAPVLGGAGNTLSYTEDDAAGITLEPALTLNDVDDTHMANATVSLSAGLTAGDILTASTAGTGIIATYTPATGLLSLIGADTTAHYLQVLQSVKFYSTSNDPTAISATRTVTWHTNDANSDLAGTGSSNNVTTTINVAALNDAPVAVADTGTTAENITLTVAAASGVLINDTDPDSSDTHRVSAVNGVAGNVGNPVTGSNGGSFTIATDGSYSFNPGAAFDYLAVGETQTTSITYTNLDSNGLSAVSTLTITVTGSNDAPVAIADTGTTAENVTLAVAAASGVLSNDTDADSSDTLRVSAVNGVAGNVGAAVTGSNGGSFTIATDGSYSFDPGTAFDDLTAGSTRATSVTYTNLDNNGGSASTTLTITVTGTNDAPVAVADTGTTAENAILTVAAASGVLSNDTDPDSSDMHRVSAVNGVAGNVGTAVTGSNGGSFTIAADGSYTFNPGTAFDYLAAGETQTTSLTYTNLDSNGLSDTSTLTITVTGANDAPVAVADTSTTAENTILTINAAAGVLANDTDPESSDTHSVSAINGVTGNIGNAVAGSNGGSFTIAADGSYSFNPGTAFNDLAAGETRTTSVSYTNLDSKGLSADSILTITVTGLNDDPIAVADTGTTAENTILTIAAASGVLSNDSDPDSSDTHRVSAINGVTGNVGAAVTGSNGGSFTIAADGSYSFNPGTAFNDLAAGETRTTSVSYTNLDSNGLSASSNLTITVTGSNDAPVVVADTGTTAENTILTVNAAGGVLTNDTDPESSDTHSVSAVNGNIANVGAAVTGNNGGSFILADDGSYTFNPGTAFDYLAVGEAQTTRVIYTNSDSNGGTATTTLTITVTGVNDAPVADNDNVMTPEDSPIVIDVLNGDTDIDGTLNPASVQLGGTAGPGLPLVVAGQGTWSVNTGTGAITFTPELNYNGTPTPVTYTVKDNLGQVSNTATVTVIVTPVDDPLTLDGLNDGAVAGTDGSVSESDLSTGTTPAGAHESASGSFTISTPDGIASLQIGSTTLTLAQLLASDATPQTLVSARGTLIINGYNPGTGAVSYYYTLTSPASSSAPINDNFALTLTDVQGGDTSTANLAIFIIDDVPIANNDIDLVTEDSGQPATGNVVTGIDTGGDSNATDGIADNIGADVNASPVTAVMAGTAGTPAGGIGSSIAGQYGSLTLNAGGSYSYLADNANATVNALPAGGSLNDVFTYQLTDADGSRTRATLTIAIAGVNDAPVAGNDVAPPVFIGNTPSVNVLANDSDAEDGRPTVIDLDPGNPGIQSTFTNADGTFTATGGVVNFTPANPAFTGSTSLNYVAIDSAGAVSNIGVASFSITPAPGPDPAPNTAPVAANDSAPPVTVGNTPSVNVLVNDSDAEDGIPALIDLDPANQGIQSIFTNVDGTFTAAGGVVTFVPFNSAFTGSTSLNYVAIDSAGAVSSVAVVNFIFSGEVTNNGSLIMITNPTPPLFPPFQGRETYELMQYGDTRPFLHNGDVYQSVHFDYRGEMLYLVGSLRNHVVLELRSYSFDVPRWAFRHSNPSERLEFEATKSDGSPLPKWLKFDPNRLRFTGIPPLGAKTTQVMVTARDNAGNEVQAYFTVIVNKEPDYPNQRHLSPDVEQPQPAQAPVAKEHEHISLDRVAGGKAGLTEQIQAAGKPGRLQESRALLDSLKQL